MATDSADPAFDLTISETVKSLVEDYQRMEMPIGQYVTFILVPALAFFLVSLFLPFFLSGQPLIVRAPIPLLGLLGFVSAVFYPKILLGQRRRQLNNQFHLMVTHMTVLAVTKIDRMEVFRSLAREEEYGELAKEMGRVVELVDTWNQSLDDACRRRAKEVPSETVADFFERLAYTINAGQSLRAYLLTEQESIIQEYSTVYESTLTNLDVMKDLYLSMILSMTFALVFAVVLPVLTGTDPTMTVGAVIVMYVFIQSGFYLGLRSIAPYDPRWYHPPEKPSKAEPRIKGSFYVGVSLSLLLAFVTFGGLVGLSPVRISELIPVVGTPMPLPLYAVIPITPLLIPGVVLYRQEKLVKARDDEYPSFIRALGTTESVKQSTSSDVLRTLREKDFGPLTENIDDLYKRLNMRIEPAEAWRYFTADCRSYLIQTFSEMYLIGREMGGDPQILGQLIGENMSEVNRLRQQRSQATTTLIGLLYGITAAATFAFFIGLEVVRILSDMELELEDAGGFGAEQLINTEMYNIPLIEFMLIAVIMFSAMLSALMIRTVDGGHKVNTYLHFVAMAWIAALTAMLTRSVVGVFLAV